MKIVGYSRLIVPLGQLSGDLKGKADTRRGFRREGWEKLHLQSRTDKQFEGEGMQQAIWDQILKPSYSIARCCEK